jgi:hypothetical protein
MVLNLFHILKNKYTGKPRYMRVIETKKFNEFAYKKTKDTFKLGDRFLKKAYFQLYVREIADKRTHITCIL